MRAKALSIRMGTAPNVVILAAGAINVGDLRSMLEAAGFEDIRSEVKEESRSFISEWMPGTATENYVASAIIEARKAGGQATRCCVGLVANLGGHGVARGSHYWPLHRTIL